MRESTAERFEARIDEVRELLRAHHVVLAYLFGSVARGEEREDSDLDVAVLLDDSVQPERLPEVRLRLTTELVGLTHANDVDVVVLNEAPPLLAFNAISEGRCFLGDRRRQVRFEVRAIQRFIDTQPLRDALAKDLSRRIDEGRIR